MIYPIYYNRLNYKNWNVILWFLLIFEYKILYQG